MLFPLLFLVSCSLVESRITFATSEVLDTADLKGAKATANFRCYLGCRVYSPTKNANIVIVDSKGNEDKSLLDLSTLAMGESYELLPSDDFYQLKNKGTPDPSFIFYVVEKNAANYFTGVVYVDDSPTNTSISAKNDVMVTVMSSSGLVAFSDFEGDFSGTHPSVFAAPFDALSSCKPVFTAATTATLPLTFFPVNSPIATIDFKKNGDKTVMVSGNANSVGNERSVGKDASAVYTSPGYIGCYSDGDPLYTLVPQINSIYSVDKAIDTDGVYLSITGYYSIANETDALLLTINDHEQKYSGKNSIEVTREGTSFQTVVDWTRNDQANDGFALQIDLISKKNGPIALPTTSLKALPPSQSTAPASAPVGPIESQSTTPKTGGPGDESTTSKSVNSVRLLMSCIAIVVFLSLW